jgi:hypothetical protein
MTSFSLIENGKNIKTTIETKAERSVFELLSLVIEA